MVRENCSYRELIGYLLFSSCFDCSQTVRLFVLDLLLRLSITSCDHNRLTTEQKRSLNEQQRDLREKNTTNSYESYVSHYTVRYMLLCKLLHSLPGVNCCSLTIMPLDSVTYIMAVPHSASSPCPCNLCFFSTTLLEQSAAIFHWQIACAYFNT